MLFLQNSNLLEKGPILSTICCYATIFIIVWFNLKKSCKLEVKLSKFIMKPLIAGMIMMYFSKIVYFLLIKNGIYEKYTIIISILSAIIFYTISVIMLKIFSKEEIQMLPNGEKISKIIY